MSPQESQILFDTWNHYLMNYSQEIVGSGTRLPGAHSCFTVSRRGTLSNVEL